MCYCTPGIRTPFCSKCPSVMMDEIEKLKELLDEAYADADDELRPYIKILEAQLDDRNQTIKGLNEWYTQEVESLKQQLAECEQYKKEMHFAHWKELYQTQLAESQAREAKLLEFVDVCIDRDEFLTATVLRALNKVRDMATDDTALKEAIRQVKQEVLQEAAELCDRFQQRSMNPAECASVIRRMSEELKND